MRFFLEVGFLLVVLGSLSSAQNCPILGPAYLPVADTTSPTLLTARTKFNNAFASDPRVDLNTTFIAIEVFSSLSKDPVHAYYHTAYENSETAQVGPDTLFRIFSISKAVTIYAILAGLSDKYWDEPVIKYVSELANGKPRDAGIRVNWSEVTLGALASQMSGVSRDYALGDGSTVLSNIPGLRELRGSDIVRCGSSGLQACTRQDAMQHVLSTYPVASSYRTPNYSSMAFQLLAYAVENITGQAFPDFVRDQLVKPLNLTRTFLTKPGSDSNAVVVSGWDLDLGDEAPGGGYYQSVADLTTLGRSIINSTLLPPLTTRKWLKPVTHTASLRSSIGRPWEILRTPVPVSLSSMTTRIVDVYTKQGGGGNGYISLLALSPDQDIGASIITAGPNSAGAFDAAKELFMDIWLPTVEQVARDQAKTDFAGSYTLPDNSSAEISLYPDEPALYLSKLISNGTDILEFIGQQTRALKGAEKLARMWLYPMGPTAVAGDGKRRIAFRGVVGAEGRKAIEDCGSWAEGDRLRWGNYPGDLFIFKADKSGKALEVEVPAIGRTLKRM
ncbi:beta-lactamase/transpeptidase-like protein [Lasiosphaeria hispida]|uniref:Beta-lactamase/transpeptidase-like protein n=1 Tax=Lasiosphaeria hispida TaxID=260671 RepID=A0AAJ0MJ44_9PEZI|nr:beta-lactamase/transpeptidase-like protein [Lasiosphaeria hispida]